MSGGAPGVMDALGTPPHMATDGVVHWMTSRANDRPPALTAFVHHHPPGLAGTRLPVH